MLKWDSLLREEYGQKITDDLINVYGQTQTLLSNIEAYYGITV